MLKPTSKHYEFLRQCADKPQKCHSTDTISPLDLEEMVKDGLLIKYNRLPLAFAITPYGSRVAKNNPDTTSPELVKLAVEYVISRGYSRDAADQIVQEHGAEAILKSQAEERKLTQKGQQEIKVPLNEQGKPEMKFKQ